MNSPYGFPPRLDQAAARARSALPGPIGRVLGVVAGTVVAIAALFVSVVAFAAVLVVGAVAGGWLWWKTRDVRRQLRGEMARMQQAMERGTPFEPGSPLNRAGRGGRAGGDVIDGDFIREAPASRQDSAGSGTSHSGTGSSSTGSAPR